MEIAREDIVRSILAKGFRPDTRPRDHDYYYLQYKGKESHIFVKISRGKEYRAYREPVLKMQAKIWGVAFRDLVKFFECEHQYDDLISILVRNGRLDP